VAAFAALAPVALDSFRSVRNYIVEIRDTTPGVVEITEFYFGHEL